MSINERSYVVRRPASPPPVSICGHSQLGPPLALPPPTTTARRRSCALPRGRTRDLAARSSPRRRPGTTTHAANPGATTGARLVTNVTFSSPVMARDVTVYAVAGDRGTILAVAKEHKIPIPFDCQDGECGSCLVEVKHLSPSQKCGIALTEKEKEVLRQLGKITRQEIEDAEVNDMPPRYRLACQCFIRNEDILVVFRRRPDAAGPAAASVERRQNLQGRHRDPLGRRLLRLCGQGRGGCGDPLRRTGHGDGASRQPGGGEAVRAARRLLAPASRRGPQAGRLDRCIRSMSRPTMSGPTM